MFVSMLVTLWPRCPRKADRVNRRPHDPQLKVGTLKVGTLKVGTLKVGNLKVGMDHQGVGTTQSLQFEQSVAVNDPPPAPVNMSTDVVTLDVSHGRL